MRKIQLNIFNQDFKDFISALNAAKVDYILVGGYSVILHGYSRTTGDLDIWVRKTEDNYKRLLSAFYSFGLPSNAFTVHEFMDDMNQDVFTFGRPPVAIDIITNIKGLEFDDTYKNSEVIEVSGLPIRVIRLQELITAKQAAGRYKDLDDLDNLKK